MTANFYTALLEFVVALALCHISGSFARREARPVNPLTVIDSATGSLIRPFGSSMVLSLLLLSLCVLLNVLWW